jgi:hypothetical protein
VHAVFIFTKLFDSKKVANRSFELEAPLQISLSELLPKVGALPKSLEYGHPSHP